MVQKLLISTFAVFSTFNILATDIEDTASLAIDRLQSEILDYALEPIEKEFVGYKLNGKLVQTEEDAQSLISELDALRYHDVEVEVDLCVVYGNPEVELDEKLDEILAAKGYVLELEGIYGSFGDHMFEVSYGEEKEYIGAFAGVYDCNE